MEKIIVEKDQQLNSLVDKFLNSDMKKVLILEFSMQDCPSCEEIKKYLKRLEKENKDKLVIKEINVSDSDLNYKFAKSFNVSITPTLIITKYNRYHKVLEGLQSYDSLNSIVNLNNEMICNNCNEAKKTTIDDKIFCKKHKLTLYRIDSCEKGFILIK